MERLGHVFSMCLTLYETAKVLSKVAAQFYSSVQNVYELKLLHFANVTRPLPTLGAAGFFNFSHFNGCVVNS